MLLVRLHVGLELRLLVALLDLAFILPLRNLLHKVNFERGVGLVLCDLSVHVGLQMSLFIDNLLPVDVDVGQPVLFEIAGPSDSHGGQSDLFLLFDIPHGLRYLLFGPHIILILVKPHALLKIKLIRVLFVRFDLIKSFLLFPEVFGMHLFQSLRMRFFLLLLGLLVRFV